MKRPLQAVIFDMDGVIVDTFELYYITNKRVAEQLSVPFTREDNERFRGIGRMDIINALVLGSNQDLSEEEKKQLADSKNAHYKQLIDQIDESFILPGMKEFIDTLKKNHIKLAIASSSTNARSVLSKIGLIHYFDYIVDPSTLQKGKPDPEIFIKAAAALKIQHENCAAIEDGEAGMKAIKLTKMFSVGIGESVKEEEPDWYVETTGEITYQELLTRFEG